MVDSPPLQPPKIHWFSFFLKPLLKIIQVLMIEASLEHGMTFAELYLVHRYGSNRRLACYLYRHHKTHWNKFKSLIHSFLVIFLIPKEILPLKCVYVHFCACVCIVLFFFFFDLLGLVKSLAVFSLTHTKKLVSLYYLFPLPPQKTSLSLLPF